jgi:hypothetical protein
MPQRKSKKPRGPGANLPKALKAPFKIDRSSDFERQFNEKCFERVRELLKHYGIKDSDSNKWGLVSVRRR